MELDEQPIERASLPGETEEPPKRPTSATTVVVIAVIGLALGAAAGWWWIRSNRAPEPTPAQTATGGEAPPAAIPGEPTPQLPPLGQMDTFLRALLGSLSAHPALARWLATDDLIRQMANAIDRISRGQSPARDLGVLRPEGEFEVVRRGGRLIIDPASYSRYDSLAAMVESLDARGVADAYRTIQPRLDEAYRALGRSESGVEPAVTAALQLLIDTPVPPETIAVVPGKGTSYAFADPRYEQLAPVQKQLLRMGPDNVQRIQARLREIRTAIDATR